ncbi:MAG: dATP/dGTP diphosphohydrolase domain-containing protein [Clostridia bacterium]|jgi:hypothetical protein
MPERISKCTQPVEMSCKECPDYDRCDGCTNDELSDHVLTSFQDAGAVSKPTNPKDVLGIKKVPLHCVPLKPILELGLAMMEGGRKYGKHNYRAMGVRGSVYFDAAIRHLFAWWEGEDIDPESGVSHVVKATACLLVMRDSMLMKNFVDDRPITYPDGLGMNELNKLAEGIITKYPNCKEPFIKDKTNEA